MFSSLVLLALTSLAAGEQAPLGSPPTVLESIPLHLRPDPISTPDDGFSNFEKAVDDLDDNLTRNATINLFPASKYAMRPMMRAGCHENEVNTISLAPEVCLSGDYYLNNNFLITEDPICSDGSIPTMLFYHQRGCSGEPQYPYKTGHSEKIPHSCIWSHSPRYWSIIFRCDIWPTTIQGADKHQTAIPPEGQELFIPGLSKEPGPDPGVVQSHLFPLCNGKRVGGHKDIMVPVDKCLTTSGLAILIKKAGECTNGTRAQWARFTDSKCGYGEIDPEFGLVDLPDTDIGKCLDVGKMRSMSFWCEGFGDVNKPDPNAPKEPETPKPEKGSVSESACIAGKAPFYNHPLTDTCMNFKTDRMKVFSTGVCANGTSAMMATFGEAGCRGTPEFKEVQEVELKTCLDFGRKKSFAFWCTGEGVSAQDTEVPANKGGVKMVVVVILSVVAGTAVIGLGFWVAFGTHMVDKIKALYSSRAGYIAL